MFTIKVVLVERAKLSPTLNSSYTENVTQGEQKCTCQKFILTQCFHINFSSNQVRGLECFSAKTDACCGNNRCFVRGEDEPKWQSCETKAKKKAAFTFVFFLRNTDYYFFTWGCTSPHLSPVADSDIPLTTIYSILT